MMQNDSPSTPPSVVHACPCGASQSQGSAAEGRGAGGSTEVVLPPAESVPPSESVPPAESESVPLAESESVPSLSATESPALPPSFGPLELTPVAANGARGPTTRIERDDIYVEPVYIPCAVSRGSTSLALWLLGPLLWIGTRGRRRAR